MQKHVLLLLVLTTLSLGCDNAVKEQQRNQAQKTQIGNDLRQLGEEMHNKSARETVEPSPEESPSENASNSEEAETP